MVGFAVALWEVGVALMNVQIDWQYCMMLSCLLIIFITCYSLLRTLNLQTQALYALNKTIQDIPFVEVEFEEEENVPPPTEEDARAATEEKPV